MEGSIMKVILRFLALILGGVMFFMGVEAFLPSFPGYMSKSTALVFVFVGIYFSLYGMTGRSSFLGK